MDSQQHYKTREERTRPGKALIQAHDRHRMKADNAVMQMMCFRSAVDKQVEGRQMRPDIKHTHETSYAILQHAKHGRSAPGRPPHYGAQRHAAASSSSGCRAVPPTQTSAALSASTVPCIVIVIYDPLIAPSKTSSHDEDTCKAGKNGFEEECNDHQLLSKLSHQQKDPAPRTQGSGE